MSEKSVFREAWRPEMTSQSTTGRKIAIGKILLLYLSVHWEELIEQIKKKSVIYTLN